MTRILPPEINKKLKKEYFLRFTSVFFLLIGIIIFINISLVSSSYLLLYLYEKAYVENIKTTNNEESIKKREELNKKIDSLYYLSKAYSEKTELDQLKISSKIFELANKGIQIESIEIIDSTITLRGRADTRDNMLLFQNKMKEEKIFENFDVPIEVLAKQKDISFNINFIYVKN